MSIASKIRPFLADAMESGCTDVRTLVAMAAANASAEGAVAVAKLILDPRNFRPMERLVAHMDDTYGEW